MFMLPFVIFSLLFKVTLNLSKQASGFLFILLFGIVCSNFLSTWLSHFVGAYIYSLEHSFSLPETKSLLSELWSLRFPQILGNDKALFFGIFSALILKYFKPEFADKMALYLEHYVQYVLNLFVYLIPLFVTGFVFKLQTDGVILTMVKDYALIFLVVAVAQFSYISLLYFIASGLKPKIFSKKIKAMIAPVIAGFSTMSSAAAMPLTIIATEKNAKNPMLAKSIIPATVNVHLIGDCFAIPIFAYAILKNYGCPEPTLVSYLIFSCYFVMAKFSVAAIPGGGILVMLPILEKYLGFSTEMLSLITALYILFDPMITCANVFGNGAFALILDAIFSKREKLKI